jgi:chromosome partitioning protein
VIALINQKGGVGKTTTTANLGAALAEMGHSVLYIDMDSQAHLTLHVGVDPDTLDKSIYHVLTDPNVSADQVAKQVSEKVWVLPAEVNLAGVESELAAMAQSGDAQQVLGRKVRQWIGLSKPGDAESKNKRPAKTQKFDYVLIDCPPSLGLLTINALALAQEVFVPMQSHFLALQGLSKLLETVNLIRQSVNTDLKVSGIILCMHEAQTALGREVMADLDSFLEASRNLDVPWRSADILQPAIRRNIKLAECPSFGKTILEYATSSAGAQDYRLLALNVSEMQV